VRFIRELESGKQSVQLDTLLRVLEALGLTLVAKSR
jgi:DNA-binding phage protein